jgi:hypothetical protein
VLLHELFGKDVTKVADCAVTEIEKTETIVAVTNSHGVYFKQ